MPKDEKTPQEPFLFQVNLGGMIDILSNHLYSSPEVFVRELLQNAVDAIAARRKTEQCGDCAVTLTLSQTPQGAPELTFADSGTGLTEAEIHRFLAVIGQSSKHDIESGRSSGDYIGRFGIGLLSCFLVSDCIRVQTCSVKAPEQSLEWCGHPDGTYTITPCEALPAPGTRVILSPKPGCEEYFTAERLAKLVRYYGLPLPDPILLRTADGSVTRLNPPFPTAETPFQQVMALGETLFDSKLLSYIPLDSPSGLFSGVAYILADETAPTVQHSHRIYLKSMLLTENGSRLLPKWAFFLRVFLNTDGLQPIASREDFYENEALLRARAELSQCITGYLHHIAQHDAALLQRIVRIHRLAVQSVAVEDDALYRAFFPYLTFETSLGNVTGSWLLQCGMPVCYTPYVDEFRQLSAISAARHMLLVNAGYTYVAELLNRIPLLDPEISVTQMKAARLDSMLDDPKLPDPASALRLLAETNELLSEYDCAASFKRFQPESLPVLYSVNEEALLLRDIHRSMEQADALFQGMLGAFASEYREEASAKLYLNTDNPLIRRLLTVTDTEKLRCCAEILYVQALLTGGHAMRRNEMELLNQDLLKLLNWSL